MRKPIRFYVIPRRKVEDLTRNNPIPQSFLNTYLESRPGILDDGQCDIFEQNCRSVKQQQTAFHLFEKRNAIMQSDIIVFPFWLELFEAAECRENIQICIDHLKSYFQFHPVVIQWNHDRDASTVPELQDLPANFFVLNYNTSKPTKNDIILPFWTVNTDPPGRDIKPEYLATFCGFDGTDLRRRLRDVVAPHFKDFAWWNDRVPEHDYFLRMRQGFFSLCPRGGGLSSYRLYESIQAHRPPVIFGDDAYLPMPEAGWEWWSFRIPENRIEDVEWWSAGLRNERKWGDMRHQLIGEAARFSLWGVQHKIYDTIMEFLK